VEPVAAIDYLRDAEPAPGRLALVERFVNTVDLEHRREMLSAPERLRDVLGLERAIRISAADLRHALEVRAALRALALANNGGEPDGEAAQVLERAAERGRLVVRFDGIRLDGVARLEPAPRDVDGALAELVGVVYTAMADGTWTRLKACRRDVCHWLFYDRSRNRSAVWCQMAVCGNRVKTKAYRERRPARSGRR
jgi:predicted RNA-binding Zn ribbon-like protein